MSGLNKSNVKLCSLSINFNNFWFNFYLLKDYCWKIDYTLASIYKIPQWLHDYWDIFIELVINFQNLHITIKKKDKKTQ